ncbi:MAG TPA: dihydroxyacetone kinase subunit DhaL [Bryobacteraceae bacterium]|nr:dihydroxyacetone kinase subunit DhaL [Bryobacteraceae bacterium]
MKKLINHPSQLVGEMVEGLLALHPNHARIQGLNVLLRADVREHCDRKVSLISGGGSGHEPAHAGYIGRGMLSAAVAGEVFTSPSANSVFAAIEAVGGRAGVVLIIKNYTGDRLNFGYAAEMARTEGLRVGQVVVADDVALLGAYDRAEARGIAGTVFVHKIAGAVAEEGRSLADVVRIAQAAADDIGSMGISLSAGTSPVTGQQSFTLAEGEAELGLGIHGEPGARRMQLAGARETVELLIEPILQARDLRAGSRVAVMVNNLGSTTPMELAIVARSVASFLESKQITVERMYAGTFLSSLDMAGISISLLGVDDERLRWLDAPTEAPAWPNVAKIAASPADRRTPSVRAAVPVERASGPPMNKVVDAAVRAAAQAILDAEPHLTELDRQVGDGDLGITLERGVRAIIERLGEIATGDTPAALQRMGLLLQDVLGGSSGPLYGVLFLKAAASLKENARNELARWAAAIEAGCAAISEIGGARAGDRTMLDALLPFANSLAEGAAKQQPLASVLAQAVKASEEGAAATAQMQPRRGRSRYLTNRALGHPDPGAVAASIWLRAVCLAISR